MTKNERIKTTLLETKNRRKNMLCKVYKVKISKSHLSIEKKNYLKMLFIEAKWIYNFILNQDNIFNFQNKLKEVFVLNSNKKYEKRNIKYLSSQMRQSIHQKVITNIANLYKAKLKGLKVGKLKFKSEINQIPLKQYNVTYKIINNKYIKIQGFKKLFKVNGLSQIPKNVEFANASLIKKNNDYYFYITIYEDKINKEKKDTSIGIDFGIKDNFILSNGIKIKTKFDYNKIKTEQKKLSKKKKGSKNYYKQKLKLNKKYEKLNNQKQNVKNKFISLLKNNFEYICIQDENIQGWHSGLFGKQIQHSILGITLSELKKYDKTKIVDRWFPTTKMCYNCGKINKIKLSERIYNCTCGLTENRDVKSAKTILKVAMGRSDIKPVEKETSAKILENLQKLSNLEVSTLSMNQEAKVL